MAGLIFGGENLPWEVLPQGEIFLELPPESQVWYLSRVWFREINWLYAFEETEDMRSFDLKTSTVAHFSAYPVEEEIAITQVIHDLASIQKTADPEEKMSSLKYLLQRVIIQPLGTFGIIKVNRSNSEDEFFSKITGIRIPALGRHILEDQKDYFRIDN